MVVLLFIKTDYHQEMSCTIMLYQIVFICLLRRLCFVFPPVCLPSAELMLQQAIELSYSMDLEQPPKM